MGWKLGLAIWILGMAVGCLLTLYGQEAERPAIRMVESVTWDTGECKLRWTVSRGGAREAGEYAIDFHSGEMTHQGVTRRLEEDEQFGVHAEMQGLGRYAAESVNWFEAQGKKK
jgi:hypothetical protein